MEIITELDYEAAKKRCAELFHADSCSTDYEESQRLMEALDQYEKKVQNIKK